MATTTTLDTLVINYLTQAQYDAAQQAGTLNANQLYLTPDTGSSGGGGTLSSVGISNATNGGLSVSGSPLTSDGSITIGHSNVLTSAQTTQAVYPIAIDKNGHVSSYGSAVTINPKTTWYGTSSTGATTQAKTVTCSGFTLETGAIVCVTFTNANTYASAKITLNVNSTGAKDVYYNNAVTSSTNTLLWKAGETVIFVYSGSYFYFAGKSANKLSAFVNDSGYITSADVPEGSSAYTGTISAVSTTASSGSNNGFARGDHVHNITSSTITSALGYTPGTSSTDENLKWTASTTSNTYYPLVSTSTATTSTANTLNGISYYQYYNTAGGYRRLDLGNSTAYKSSGGAYGTIRLYGAAATYYGDLVPGVLGTTSGDGHISANRTWTLPDKTGTIALTSDIPTVPTISLNGSSTTSASFYAPTGAGTSGQYLKSNGSGAPSWATITIPSITLNGSSSTSPSFYAPTSAGTSGYYLKSNGSGAPTWASFPTDSDENVHVTDGATDGVYYGIPGVEVQSLGETTTLASDYDFKFIKSTTLNTMTLIVGDTSTGCLGLGKPTETFTYIKPNHTTNRTITLPDASGTVSLLETTYPVGSIYTTSTNTNPGTWLGGTWTLIDKSYKYQWITSGFTFNSTNIGGGDFVAIPHGHSIAFRLNWTFKIAVSDSEIEIGTLTKTSVGITATSSGYLVFPVAFNDMYNAIGQGAFNFANDTTALFKTYDWVTRATSYPAVNADNSSYVYFVYVARGQSEMIDSFCDQFVWKRTA